VQSICMKFECVCVCVCACVCMGGVTKSHLRRGSPALSPWLALDFPFAQTYHNVVAFELTTEKEFQGHSHPNVS
jgi:hypothetical protein